MASFAAASETSSLYESLKLEGRLSKDVFEKAYKGYTAMKKRGLISKDGILTVIDYSLPSSKKRFTVIDLNKKKVLYHELAAHGRGSGEANAKVFSNEPETHASSLGFYTTAGTYNGKNGYSLILDGHEKGYNDKAKERSIVMHGAWYVTEEFVKQHGRTGRSWGCPVLDKAIAKDVIDTIKGGSCLFIYYPDEHYLKESDFLK